MRRRKNVAGLHLHHGDLRCKSGNVDEHLLKRDKISRIVFCMVTLAAFCVLLWGCSIPDSSGTEANRRPETAGSADTIQSTITATAGEEDADARCKVILEKMTPEQKIGQMIMPSMEQYEDENGNLTNLTELNEEYRQAILDYGFGGIVLFSSNMENTQQEIKLISDMQEAAVSEDSISGIPLFISIDQEGGSVGRIPDATVMTGNMALAATGERAEENTRETAGIIGEEVSALGINMDFAPVMDVNNNPSNPVIGVRSFGSDPETVARLGNAFKEALQQKGVIPVLKHFPGHGDTDTDSHTGLPSIDKSLEKLSETELVPFKKSIEEGADMIMTSHIQFPQIETETYTSTGTGEKICLPATLSKKMITGVLREELGFDGVLITDSLVMGAISDNFDPKDAAALAINAGADILLMPMTLTNADDLAQMGEYIQAILAKVQSGEIPQERIDESVLRILKLKMKYGILDNIDETMDETSAQNNENAENATTSTVAESSESGTASSTASGSPTNTAISSKPSAGSASGADAVIGSQAHHEAEWEIMSQAVTLVRNESILPLAADQYHKVVFLTMNADMQNSVDFAMRRLAEEGIIPEDFSYEVLPMRQKAAEEGTSGENITAETLRSRIRDADLVIAISVVTTHNDMDPETEDGEQAALIREAIQYEKSHGGRSVVISSWLPYDAAIYQEADAILLTYGYQKMPEIPEGLYTATPDTEGVSSSLTANSEAGSATPDFETGSNAGGATTISNTGSTATAFGTDMEAGESSIRGETGWKKVPGYGVNLPSAICAAFGEYTPSGILPVDIPAVDNNYEFTEKILYPEGYGILNWKSDN